MLRVIKLGGSLLTLQDWHERFLRWLATEPPAVNLLLIGGGELVDCLRREHERFPYPERQMHLAALAAMEINAQLALARLPQAMLFDPNSRTVNLPEPPSVVLVKVTNWWNSSQGEDFVSEESWRLTSDSLAALLAVQQQAAELVLLKSAEPPSDEIGCSRAATWVAHGYVDPLFASSLAGFAKIRAINLRGQGR